jgi:hypothetical protein
MAQTIKEEKIITPCNDVRKSEMTVAEIIIRAVSVHPHTVAPLMNHYIKHRERRIP